MGALRAIALTMICMAGLAISKLGHPGGPLTMHREAPDSFKIMTKFVDVVAISDSDNDTILECLSTKRIDIDPITKTGTYKYFLATSGQTFVMRITPGEEPGTVILISDIDPTPREGTNYYTDYENCVVADVELRGDGHQCTLWAQSRVKDNVPQDCVDHFVDTCGVIVPPHSRDLCPDGEGDY